MQCYCYLQSFKARRLDNLAYLNLLVQKGWEIELNATNSKEESKDKWKVKIQIITPTHFQGTYRIEGITNKKEAINMAMIMVRKEIESKIGLVTCNDLSCKFDISSISKRKTSGLDGQMNKEEEVSSTDEMRLTEDSSKVQDAGGPDLITENKAGNTILTTARDDSTATTNVVSQPIAYVERTINDHLGLYKQMTDRWYKAHSFEWKISDANNGVIQRIDLPFDLIRNLSKAPVRRLLDSHAWWRPRMTLRIQINATKFHGGTLVAAVYYYSRNSLGKEVYVPGSVHNLIAMKHIRLNASSSNPGEIEIDYFGPWNWIPTNDNKIGFKNYIATLYFGVLNKLSTADSNCLSADVITYVKFSACNNVAEFSGMRTDVPAMNIKTFLEGQMDAIADIIGVGQEAITVAERIVGKAFTKDEDRPTRPTDALEVTTWQTPNLSLGDGPIPLKSMRLQKASVTPFRPDVSSDPSEFSLRHVVKTYGLLDRFIWKSDTTHGGNLWSWAVSPIVLSNDNTAQPILRTAVPLSVASSFYTHWRGGLKLKFVFGSSAMHTGRLRLLYFPDANAAVGVNTNNMSDFVSTVFDLEEQVEFTWVVPYQQVMTFSPIFQYKNDLQTWAQPLSYGRVFIQVENRLRCMESITKQIDCSILIAADDDFELAVPRMGLHTSQKVFLEGQIGEEHKDKCILRPLPMSKVISRDVFGESWDLPKLVRRFNFMNRMTRKETRTNVSEKVLTITNNFEIPVTPMNERVGSHTVSSLSPLSVLSYAYKFWRGSLRYSFNFTSNHKFTAYLQHIPYAYKSLPSDISLEYRTDTVNDGMAQDELLKGVATESTTGVYNSTIIIEVPFYSPANVCLNDIGVIPEDKDGDSIAYAYVQNGLIRGQIDYDGILLGGESLEYQTEVAYQKAAGDDFSFSMFQGFNHLPFEVAMNKHKGVNTNGTITSALELEPQMGHHSSSHHEIDNSSRKEMEKESLEQRERERIQRMQKEMRAYDKRRRERMRQECYAEKFNKRNQNFSVIDVLKVVSTLKHHRRRCQLAIRKILKKNAIIEGQMHAIKNMLPSPKALVNSAIGTAIGAATTAVAGPTAGAMAMGSYLTAPLADSIGKVTSAADKIPFWFDKNISNIKEWTVDIGQRMMSGLIHLYAAVKTSDVYIKISSIVGFFFDLGFLTFDKIKVAFKYIIDNVSYFIPNNDVVGQDESAEQHPQPSLNETIERYNSWFKIIIPSICGILGFAASYSSGWPKALLTCLKETFTMSNTITTFIKRNLDFIRIWVLWCIGKNDERVIEDLVANSKIESMKRWALDVIRITEGHARDQVMANVALKKEVHSLYEEGQNYLILQKQQGIETRSFMLFYKKIVDLHQAIGERVGDGKVIKEPVCLWLYGKPGVGKSNIAQQMCVDLLREAGVVYDGPAVYVRSTNEYMNGYYGNPIILYDDFLCNRSQDVISRQVSEYFQLLSAAEYNIPMAHLDDKNRIANPEIVCILSNAKKIQLNAVADQDAFDRRRDFLVEVDISKKLREKYPGIKDLNDTRLVAEDFAFNSHLTFKVVPDPRDCIETDEAPKSYDDFMVYAKKRFVTLRNTRVKLANDRHKANHSLSTEDWLTLLNENVTNMEKSDRDSVMSVIPDLKTRLLEQMTGTVEAQCKNCDRLSKIKAMDDLKTVSFDANIGGEEDALMGFGIFDGKCVVTAKDFAALSPPIAADNQAYLAYLAIKSGVKPIVSEGMKLNDTDFAIMKDRFRFMFNSTTTRTTAYDYLLGNKFVDYQPSCLMDYLPNDCRSLIMCDHWLIDPCSTTICPDTGNYVLYTDKAGSAYSVPISEPCCSGCYVNDPRLADRKHMLLERLFLTYFAVWQHHHCHNSCDYCGTNRLNHIKGVLARCFPSLSERLNSDKVQTEEDEEQFEQISSWLPGVRDIASTLYGIYRLWRSLLMMIFIIKGLLLVLESIFGMMNWFGKKVFDVVNPMSYVKAGLINGNLAASGDVRTQPSTSSGRTVQRAIAKVLEGQNSAGVTKNIIRNTCVWVAKADDGSVISVNALGIYNRKAVVPNHFLSRFGDVKTFLTVSNAKGEQKQVLEVPAGSITSDIIKFKGLNTDLSVVTFPKTIPLFKDIRGSIVSVNDLNAVTSKNYLVQGYNGETCRDHVYMLDNVKFEHIEQAYKNTGEVYQILGWGYNFGFKGLCGSALVDIKTNLITGVHTCGSPDGTYGFSTVVVRELFPNIPEAVTQEDPEVVEGDSKIKINGDMVHLSLVPQNQVVNLPTKTKIVKGPAFGLLRKPMRYPSLLAWPGDVVPGYGPMSKGISNHVLPLSFDTKVLDVVEEELTDFLLQVSKPVLAKPSSKRTLFESINGLDGVPFFESIYMNTSPGYPLSHEFPGKKKNFFVHRDDDNKVISINRRLVDLYSEQLNKRKSGVVPFSPYQDFLKDERRPLLIDDSRYPKMPDEIKKTRLINGCSFQETIIWRQYCIDFFSAIQNSRFENGIAIGINPDSFEWTLMVKRLTKVSSNILEGDYSNFGPTIHPMVQSRIVNIVNRWYAKYTDNNSAENDLIRKTLFEGLLFSQHVAGDAFYQCFGGAPSGNPFTAPNNSICNLFYLVYIWKIIFKDDPVKSSFNYMIKNFSWMVYGDDFIGSVSDIDKDSFNNITISKVLGNYNIKFTNPSKTEDTYKYSDLYNSKFLKRSFKAHPFIKGVFLAPMDKEVIEDIPSWIRLPCFDLKEQTAINMDSCLRLAFGHGIEYFKEVRETCSRWLSDNGVNTILPTWNQINKECFNDLV